MGTPKKTKFNQEVSVPTIGEKIRLLEIGKEAGMSLSLEWLPKLLEEAKDLLLPLVSGFDKPIFPDKTNCPAPKGFQKARGMRLYSEAPFNIWLERSGFWIVRLWGRDDSYQRVDSEKLAKIMLEESGKLLRQSFHWSVVNDLVEEIPSLKNIAFFNALVLCVLLKFFENAQKMIEERERKFYLMKGRLNVLGEFVQSLDPLLSQGKTVKMDTYTILYHHEHGCSSDTDTYLCQEALEPFWKEIKTKRIDPSAYREQVSAYNFDSLAQFLQRMVWIFEEIQKERERRKVSVENWRTGRLPLTEGELKVIEEAVKSITAKE